MRVLAAVVTALFIIGCKTPISTESIKPTVTKPVETTSPPVTVESKRTVTPGKYWASSTCRGCHVKIFKQYSQSMHAKSFTNPVFQAQYFKELLPRLKKDGNLLGEARGCIACHAPIAYVKSKGQLVSMVEQVDTRMSGVTCDFCHTITGYTGASPNSGNYISEPGEEKLGPFKQQSNWHHVYSELHTKSEFCAICHNAVNRYGLEIKSTFTEWKASRYAKDGIQCQDCHMNKDGFLTEGKARYESGKAAFMTFGKVPERKKLYTHRFPGAHSKTQVTDAVKLTIGFDKPTASPGDKITVYVLVNNTKTGHKMPSGSAELRLLLLEVKVKIGNKVVPILAGSKHPFDVSGNGGLDQRILGKNIPEGRRVYRVIFVDQRGKRTMASYDAVKILFDNRLKATEIRKEAYRFRIPYDAKGTLSLTADLYFFPYPGSFAERLGLPQPQAINVASVKRDIVLNR